MSSNSPVNEEMKRKAERMKELIAPSRTLSSGKAERIYKSIVSTVPEKTSKDTVLEIIYSCDGNMTEIERKVAELWEDGVKDDWTPVLSRSQKSQKKAARFETDRSRRGRRNPRPQNRHDKDRRSRPTPKRAEPVAVESPEEPVIQEIVEKVEEPVVPEVVEEEPAAPVEQPEVQPAPEECAPVEKVEETPAPVVAEPEPVKSSVVPETPAPRMVKQTKRVVKKVQHHKPAEFSLGAFASVSIGAPISIGVAAAPVQPSSPETTPAPEPAKPKEDTAAPAAPAAPVTDVEYNNMYGYYYPNMYPGYPQPHVFFPDYYPAPGMNQEASFTGIQVPPVYSGVPTDKNFTRPVQQVQGMNPPSDAATPNDQVPGMNHENPMMYGQQGNVPFMAYASYPNSQGYMYGGYPRTMMSHNPQQNYPKQNAPGMFDARPAVSAGTPQADSYANAIPTNRGMMERMEVPQQNMDNAAKGYYAYSQRNQPLNTPWMRNPENRY